MLQIKPMPRVSQISKPAVVQLIAIAFRRSPDARLGKLASSSLGEPLDQGLWHMQSHQIVNAVPDPEILGLRLLAHVIADGDLGARFLTLTGLAADDLRSRAADSNVLAALVDFVAANEGDLVAAAESLGVRPQAIIAAGIALGGASTP